MKLAKPIEPDDKGVTGIMVAPPEGLFYASRIKKERLSIAQDYEELADDLYSIIYDGGNLKDLNDIHDKMRKSARMLRAGDTASPLQPRGGEGTSGFKEEQVLRGERREEPALPKERKLGAGSEGTT